MNMAKRITKTVTPLVPAKRGRKPKELKIVIDPMQPSTIKITLPYGMIDSMSQFGQTRGLTLDDIVRVSVTGMMRRSKYYDLDTKVHFGKLAGENMEACIRFDPKYVHWCISNIEGMTLSPRANDLLEEMLSLPL